MSQRRFFQTTLSRYFFGRLATALRRQASVVIYVGVTAVTMGACHGSQPTPEVHDPGVRGGPPGAGGPLPRLAPDESSFFQDGLGKFVGLESVPDGLGPRFNSNQCSSCHSQPSVGGSSPTTNRAVPPENRPVPQKVYRRPVTRRQEPAERSRHICGTSLESSMLTAVWAGRAQQDDS